MSNRQRKINTSALDGIGLELDFLNADPYQALDSNALRVEHIPAQLIRPDAAQPRRVLPESIYWEFHQEQLTPTQAMRDLVQSVQIIARQKSRPFQMVLDLLPNPEAENDLEDNLKYTPEEQLLRELVNLAVTIRDDGQVNPLTVVDCSQGVSRLYRIETGERRYWATWLLMDFIHGYQGDGSIPCIIIPSQRASVFRQAKENTARSGLNAIAMARQVALLILAVHGIQPPDGPVTNDFYRQALEHDLRGKREYTADILAAMGGITKGRLRQFKSLLGLADEALELADRYAIDEFKLRPILNLPKEFHLEVVRQIVELNLSSQQVKTMCEENAEDKKQEDPTYQPPRYATKVAKSILKGDSGEIHELINAMVIQEDNPEIIRVRLQGFVRFVEEYLANL